MSVNPPLQTPFWLVTQSFHVSLGRKDCMTDQNSVCEGGYVG